MKQERTQREDESDHAAEIDTLIANLSCHDDAVRSRAVHDLVAVGPPASTALVRALGAERVGVRWRAALALRGIADPATTPALLDELEDEDIGVRWLAAETLSIIGMPALPVLLERLIHRADSVWFRDGAKHVLLSHVDGPVGPTVTRVLYALQHQAAEVAAPVAAYKALRELEGGGIDAHSSPAPSS